MDDAGRPHVRSLLTRRDFLWASLSAAAASLVATACGRRRAISPASAGGEASPGVTSPGVVDCIVLGAGIAGVTAARDLQRGGLRVLLLEGSGRVGGRMYSKRDVVAGPDGRYIPIEAGAEYVHVENGKRYHEFWNELTRHGFTTSKFPKTEIQNIGLKARNRVFFPAWGRTRTTDDALKQDPELVPVAGMFFLLELQQLFDLYKHRDVAAGTFAKSLGYWGRGVTITQYTLSAHTPGLLADPPPGLPHGTPNPNDTISIAGILADEIPAQLTEPAEYRLELERAGATKVCGYDTLPQVICQEFLAAGGTLRTSTAPDTPMKIVRVERTDDGLVVVTTKDGERFAARSAISTFSVGMLDPETGEGDAIFGDLLTKEKKKSLEVVKMGPITKFGLQFKERVWNRDGGGNMSVLSNPEGRARTFFSSFPDQPGGPHVLTGLLMSKDHLAIRSLDDAQAIQFLLDEIQKIYEPNGARWTPEAMLVGTRDAHGVFVPSYQRQDWEKDEFAKGGNSFLRYHPAAAGKMKPANAREALKNPRDTLPLFWAGEATAPAYDSSYQPLSVHGAYISGVRAAEDVRHYLTVCAGDASAFDAYYKERYPKSRRSLLEHVSDFFENLFS